MSSIALVPRETVETRRQTLPGGAHSLVGEMEETVTVGEAAGRQREAPGTRDRRGASQQPGAGVSLNRVCER